MFQSQILSKLSRLALLSVFCTGLFFTSGEFFVGTHGVEIINEGVESVMAEETLSATTPTNPAQTEKQAMDTTINSIISFLNLGIGILTFLITPLIMLAGWLLSPDWTFGEIFGLRPILHQLWILVSNVVYVIFGFMLVFIAFANIFGGEHSKAYEMKTMLPKLVTGMLIVPFTWFIVSAVLSVSNVLTASVIQLPVSTILKAGGETSGFLKDPIIPKTIIYSKGASFGADSSTGANGFTNNKEFTASNCSGGSTDCLTIEEFLTNGKGGAYNLLSVYAYGIFRIQEYKEISIEEGINKVLDIASKLGFGIIFFVIFGILVIAIIYALFSRALMLWLYAMFSPIFALTFVLGDKAKKLEKFTIKEFISLAMVPVYVSAALAFGLMFLGLVMGATDSGGDGKITSDVVTITPEGDSTTTFKFGEITLTTVGLLTPKLKSGTGKALDIGKGVIGTIIVNVLALAILWMAVMAALGASKITEAAVAPIKGFGDEIGKLAMKAPQYVPIPLPGGKEVSMASMQQIGSMPQQALSSRAAAQSEQFREGINKTFGGNIPNTQAIDSIKRKMQNGITSEEWKDVKNEYLGLVSKHGHTAPALKELKEELIKNISTNKDTKLSSADLNGLSKEDIKDDRKLAQALMGTNPAEIDKFLKANGPNNGLVHIENKFTVGKIDLDANKTTGKTTITLDNHSISDIQIKVKDGKLENKDDIGDKIRGEAARQKITLKKEEIENIIKDIESQIPKS